MENDKTWHHTTKVSENDYINIKVDVKTRTITGEKEGSIYLEHKTIQICILQTTELQNTWTKNGELKGKIHKSTIILGDIKIPS